MSRTLKDTQQISTSQAINAEFVEAVELLLEHEELIHKENEPYVSCI